ncbi:MAG: TRAP transporter TatT component family protein [Kofleriaceae bacterium]
MRWASAAAIAVACASGCDMGQFTVNTTAKVLGRAQPAIKMEADYELAARAIPGSLKTVEGFWVVNPNNPKLTSILTEGYCQYGLAFVDDEWEVARFAGDFERADYHSARATKMYTRCLNYALRTLGSRWQKEIFADVDTVNKLLADTSSSQRTALMWATVALGSMIQHNMANPDMLSRVDQVSRMLDRVLAFDAKSLPSDRALAALPHIAKAQIYAGKGVSAGGDPKAAIAEFETAIQLTDGKYLLPRVMMAFKVGKQTQDRAFFHKHIMQVLSTPPDIWPEQRLANEVAHRRARRYLAAEKELFP